MIRVKICGLTNMEDAVYCEEIGVDALGFVSVDGRARTINISLMKEIIDSLGPFTTKVIVYKPKTVDEAINKADRAGVNAVQLYSLGIKEMQQIKDQGFYVIRAVKPNDSKIRKYSEICDAILFEKGIPGKGSSWDYSLLPINLCERFIIAGGLTPENVGEALKLKPYAVDVSSGVEDIVGKKNHSKVFEFIKRCKNEK